MMAEATKKASRIGLLATVCAAALSAGLIFGSPLSAAAQNQPQPQPQPKKKKLPPGAKGFAQYATRDASDKLATGGATRTVPTEKAAVDAQAAMARGDAAYEAGRYKEAIEAYSTATTLMPRLFRAHYALGAAYEAAGQFKEAAAAYKMAVALRPDPVTDNPNSPLLAQYALANSQAAAGQHAEAVNTYRQVINTIGTDNPASAKPYYNLALSLDALGRQQEAVEAFQQAVSAFEQAAAADPEVRSDPKYAEAHYNLGVIHSRAERYPEAIESFKRALAVRADYADALYNLGLAYYLTDDNAGLAEQQKRLRALNSPLAAELAKLTGR